MSWSNQNDSSFLASMTGIRSWMGLSRSLAVVAMIAQDLTVSSVVSGHTSHRPANAKASPDAIVVRMARLNSTLCQLAECVLARSSWPNGPVREECWG